jgi:hypothetical protein
MEEEFETKLPEDMRIILAWYGHGSYCGNSYVLFEKDGKLYENNASHCSCYGLEKQWAPEEVSLEYLKHIDEKGDKFDDEYDGYEEAKLTFHKAVLLLEYEKAEKEKKNVRKKERRYRLQRGTHNC